MATTVKQVSIASLKLLGKVNRLGAVDENRQAVYLGMAPSYLTLIQSDISNAENTEEQPEPLLSLSDEVSITDYSAQTVAPAGMAMLYAKFDNDTAAQAFWSDQYYNNLLPKIHPDSVTLTDHYNTLCDRDMRNF